MGFVTESVYVRQAKTNDAVKHCDDGYREVIHV